MADERHRQGESSMASGEGGSRAGAANHLRRAAEASSSSAGAGAPAFVGRHRLSASLTHLHNQINILQDELEQLDTIGESSIVCRQLVPSVESIPDPLLPVTTGPADAGWDRWFGGENISRKHKRWI